MEQFIAYAHDGCKSISYKVYLKVNVDGNQGQKTDSIFKGATDDPRWKQSR